MGEDRKERIADLLDSSDAKPGKGRRHKVSFSGSHNIVVVGGDLTIGRKALDKKETRSRAQRESWREEVRAAIRARAFELRLTEEQVVTLAASVLRKSNMISLDSLSASELGRVFDAMHTLKRPALE